MIMELSKKQESRARKLHEESVVIIAHDHLWSVENVEAMRRGGVCAKTVKLTVDSIDWNASGQRVDIEGYEGCLKRALIALDGVYDLADHCPNKVMIARTAADIVAAKNGGKVSLALGLEGPRPLEGSLEVLRVLYRLGLRDMQLTWAAPNQLITDGMLNEFGCQVVREMNRLGILIDLSHLSDKAFYQVLELSADPVIMSHTACWSVSETSDSMGDEKIKALAAKGGVIALHFVSGDYIKARHGTEQATLEDFIDHVDHIRSLVGIGCIALGGDYFPTTPDDNWAWVKEIEDISLMPNVTLGLMSRGYSDEEIVQVLGANLLRLYQRVWR